MVPIVALPGEMPFTDQVTAAFIVFTTDAENCFVPPGTTLALEGETITWTLVSPPDVEVT